MYPWSPVSLGGSAAHHHPSSLTTPSAQLPSHLTAHLTPPCSLQILPKGIVASPMLWSKQDVKAWLKFCAEDFSIEHVRPEKFHMNGKALCLLTRKDFMERDPSSGDVLYNALQRLLSAKGDASFHPHYTTVGSAFSLPNPHVYKASHMPAKQPNGIIFLAGNGNYPGAGAVTEGGCSNDGSDSLCSESVTHIAEVTQRNQVALPRPAPGPILTQPPITMPPQLPVPSPTTVNILTVGDHHHKHAEVPDGVLSPAPTTDQESTSSDADSVNNESMPYERCQREGGGGGGTEGGLSMLLQHSDGSSNRHNNGSNNGTTGSSANGQGPVLLPASDPALQAENDVTMLCGGDVSGDCRLLWEFIYQLLQEGRERGCGDSRSFVCWEGDGADLVFRIVNPTGLAELWGHQKNRTNMTYEKLSRALRYYYKMNIIKKVPGKRLTYKFLQHPTKIQKGQRGAKPLCMRNLAPNPHSLIPNPTTPSPQPQTPTTPRQSPMDPRSAPLSPSASDGLGVANSPDAPHHFPASTPPETRSLPHTPVHILQTSRHRRASLSPRLDDHVRSTLKERLHDRQLVTSQPKLESPDAPTQNFHRDFPKRHRHYLEILHHERQQHLELQQQQPCNGTTMMECDFQEEPEDLSLKPVPPFSKGNPSVPPSSRSPRYSSINYSPSPPLGVYHVGYPAHSFTPPPPPLISPMTYMPSPCNDNSDAMMASEVEEKATVAEMKRGQECEGALPAANTSPSTFEGAGAVIKAEPVFASVS